MATAVFPAGRGNPFFSVIVPPVWIYTAMYDSLTTLDGSGAVQPSLAIAWDRTGVSTWRVKLRSGVTFSNGEIFDAAAVIKTFAYLRSPAGKVFQAATHVKAIRDVRADGKDSVIFETNGPDPILPRQLAAIRVPAPEQLQRDGMSVFSGTPVGTGPFKVESWTEARISLSAFKGSWRPPKVDALEFTRIAEPTSRLQALISGSTHIAFALDPDSGALLQDNGHRLVAERAASNFVVAFRTGIESPLKDVRVRQALNYAVDKSAIVKGLLNGQSTVAAQLVPTGTAGAAPDVKPYPFDPDKARALLAEAGYPKGFPLTVEAAVSGGSNAAAIYSMVASDLRKVGVEATIALQPNAEIVRRIAQGGWQGQAFMMTMDEMPTLDPLRPFGYSSCASSAPWHCDPADTPGIAAAEQELNPDQRRTMIQGLLRRYHDTAPMLYLFQLVNFTGVSARVSNFESTFGLIRYDALELNPARP